MVFLKSCKVLHFPDARKPISFELLIGDWKPGCRYSEVSLSPGLYYKMSIEELATQKTSIITPVDWKGCQMSLQRLLRCFLLLLSAGSISAQTPPSRVPALRLHRAKDPIDLKCRTRCGGAMRSSAICWSAWQSWSGGSMAGLPPLPKSQSRSALQPRHGMEWSHRTGIVSGGEQFAARHHLPLCSGSNGGPELWPGTNSGYAQSSVLLGFPFRMSLWHPKGKLPTD